MWSKVASSTIFESLVWHNLGLNPGYIYIYIYIYGSMLGTMVIIIGNRTDGLSSSSIWGCISFLAILPLPALGRLQGEDSAV